MNEDALCHVDAAAAIDHIMMVSRVVWDHIVAPVVAPHDAAWLGTQVGADDCVWVVAAAEALFPLVPRACRALLAATLLEEWGRRRVPNVTASRYAVLRCGGMAGGCARCIEWIVRNKATRNNAKECVAVLKGLCAGGHIEIAEELVQSRRTIPWRGGSLHWPVDDPDLLDRIRYTYLSSHSLLYEACWGGNLETVKWVMSKFGVGVSAWELVEPFQAAVRKGNVEIVKWLASSTAVLSECRTRIQPGSSLELFVASPNLEVMQLCTEWFFGESAERPQKKAAALIRALEGFEQIPNVEELCQWIKAKYSMTEYPEPERIRNARILKWALTNFSIQPTTSHIQQACRVIGDAELLKWLLAAYGDCGKCVGPSCKFQSACGNSTDNEEVVKLLLPRITPHPSRSELVWCLAEALRCNNVLIAEWLENTFHLLEDIARWRDPSDFFLYVCKQGLVSSGVSGVLWAQSHIALSQVSVKAAEDGIEWNFLYRHLTLVLLLLKTFSASSVSIRLRPTAVSVIVECGDISQAKQIIMHGCAYSAEHIARGLTHAPSVHSGKVVQWMINTFNLTEEQVKANDNHLLYKLIEKGKAKHVVWLIHKFYVTLDEVVRMNERWRGHASISLLQLRECITTAS
ncbi:hypothetical protein Pelo_18174 [Pelomyxa schiedti]|nr:hypothetical protein Pelo_18174 [Pelomyxa schiedti]